MKIKIRPIQPNDNAQVAAVVRSVLIDFEVPKVGSAYSDASLDCMYESYQNKMSRYFVIEEENRVIGGGGIAPLANFDGNVCELQKMYFLPQARGKGIGTKLIDKCLQEAVQLGYESCYLETMHYMKAAQNLYKKYGFEQLDGPMGDTGHHACGVQMLKKL